MSVLRITDDATAEEGQPYGEQLVGTNGEAPVVVVLVCVYCG